MASDISSSSPQQRVPRFGLDPALMQQRKDAIFSASAPTPRKKRRSLPFAPIVVVVLLIGGLVAAVAAAGTNLDLRNFAWGGIRFNQAALQGQSMNLESTVSLASENREAAQLFLDLSRTYYNADVANIDVPEFQVRGVVFKQYDAELDQTLVFGRLENLPLIQAIPQMWLSDGNIFVPSGIGQLTLENGVPVGYFMTALEGDDAPFDTLHFSYDESVDVTTPTAVFLSVDFDEPVVEAQQ